MSDPTVTPEPPDVPRFHLGFDKAHSWRHGWRAGYEAALLEQPVPAPAEEFEPLPPWRKPVPAPEGTREAEPVGLILRLRLTMALMGRVVGNAEDLHDAVDACVLSMETGQLHVIHAPEPVSVPPVEPSVVDAACSCPTGTCLGSVGDPAKCSMLNPPGPPVEVGRLATTDARLRFGQKPYLVVAIHGEMAWLRRITDGGYSMQPLDRLSDAGPKPEAGGASDG